MGDIVDIDTFGQGYDQGYQAGQIDGFRICENYYERKIAKILAEIMTLNARVTVLERKL